MEKSNIEKIVERYKSAPSSLDNGAGFLAKKWGFTKEEIKVGKKQYREQGEGILQSPEPLIKGTYERECEKRVNNEKGTLESSVETTYEPKDDIELAKLHRIDLNKYKISTYWSKLKSNGKFTSSVLASLKKPSEFSVEDFAKFLDNYKPQPLTVNLGSSKEQVSEKVDVEISIADFHLDRLTLKNNNIQERKDEYLKVLTNLVKVTFASYSVVNYNFIIGNDFFNSDNYQGTTTNLTPQDNSVSWNKAYEEGFDLLVRAINILESFSENVNVILVNGNHDRTKSYFLAHALEVHFKDNDYVKFDRTVNNIKHYVSGETFIGFHHGNCKIDELPLLFATSPDSSKDFGNCKFREIHTADKHHYMAKEVKGVRIQQIPSMVNPDRWSTDGLYVNNIRAGLAFVYHPTKGKIAEFEERI